MTDRKTKARWRELAKQLTVEDAEYLYGVLDQQLYGDDHYREWLERQAFPNNVVQIDQGAEIIQFSPYARHNQPTDEDDNA